MLDTRGWVGPGCRGRAFKAASIRPVAKAADARALSLADPTLQGAAAYPSKPSYPANTPLLVIVEDVPSERRLRGYEFGTARDYREVLLR